MSAQPALYVGSVMHARLRPRRHNLRYGMYSLLADLDDLDGLEWRSRWLSVNRFNLFSLHEADHGAGTPHELATWVRGELRAAGLAADGTILLLTMPRILGYVFNPLSLYFCHDAHGALAAILYEVNNTFGERHCYLLEVAPGERAAGEVLQRCAKAMHVSPFIALDMDYHFRVEPPRPGAAQLSLQVDVHDPDGRLLIARYAAQRRELCDATLLRVFITHPLLTLKVITGIHWEALRLWVKGIKVHSKPAQAPVAITVLRTGS